MLIEMKWNENLLMRIKSWIADDQKTNFANSVIVINSNSIHHGVEHEVLRGNSPRCGCWLVYHLVPHCNVPF